MSIPEGFKLVPVEPTEEMLQAAYTEMGTPSCCVFDGAAYQAMLATAPAPPQPIFDEAKERELFAEFSKRIILYDSENFPIRWCDCVPDEDIEVHLDTWLACAQSRAKAGEDE